MGMQAIYRGIKYASAKAATAAAQKKNEERQKKIREMKAFKHVSVMLDQWVQRNFKSEGGNVGGWKPFAHGGRILPNGTIDTNAKLLQDTGLLRSSFKPFYTDKTAGIGSDLPYAPLHNYGKGAVPARRMLPNRADVIEQAQKIFKFFTGEAIK
jgi:phage gpG-like protein